MDIISLLNGVGDNIGVVLAVIFALIAAVILLAPKVGLIWMWRARRPLRGGVEGEAHVVAASTSYGRGVFETCAMDMVIRAPNLPPTAVTFRGQVRVARWPNPGQVLPVSVDPANPHRFRIMWNRVPKAANLGRLAAETLANSLRGGNAGRESTYSGPQDNGLLGGLIGGTPINIERDVTIIGDLSKMTDTQRERLRAFGIDPDKLAGGPPTS